MQNQRASVRFTLTEKESHAPRGRYAPALRLVPAWAMFIGLCGCLVTTFDLPCMLWLLIAAAAAVLVVFECLQGSHKRQFLAFCGFTAASLAIWLAAAKYTRAGVTIISNAMTRLSSINNLEIIPQYQITLPESSWPLAVTLFLLPLAFLFALLCGFAVRRRNVFIPLGCVAALFAAMAIFRSYGGAVWLVPVFLVLCYIICSRTADNAAGFAMLLPTAAMLVGCLLLWVCSLGTNGGISAYFSAKRTELEHRAHVSSYEKAEQAMPEGRLGEATRFVTSGGTALTVTLKKPCSMYLRGFTGGELTRDGWSALSGEEFYDARAVFYRLHKDGFYPESQHNTLSFVLGYADEEKLYDMTVEPVNACSAYVYTPYEFASAQEDILPADLLGDGGAKTVDGNVYHYRVQPRLTIKYPLLATRLAEYNAAGSVSEALAQYNESESRYRSFVYTHYIDINDELEAVLEDSLAKGADAGESHLAYSDAKALVQSFLADHMTYSTSPKNAFDGTGDTLRDIIRGKGDGYSTHYASLAAVLLRYYGIPTRYVEGYIITSADAKEMKDGEPYSIPMSQAHAWVEYYHDGVGWVPFEVTPGYEDLMDETKDTTESDAVLNPTEAPENSNASDFEPPEEDKEVSPALWVLLVLALLIALWFTARILVLRYYDKECNDEDANAAVLACMRRILRVLGALGYTVPALSLYDMIPQLSKNDEPHFEDNYRTAVDIAGKAQFSREGATSDEAAAMRKLLRWYTHYCDKTQPTAKRLLLRYILWLY